MVHLIHRRKHYETQSKDYEFSRVSMQEHWQAGRDELARQPRDRVRALDGALTRVAFSRSGSDLRSLYTAIQKFREPVP